MDQFSQLNKSGSISHSSSGVWRIQKKRKIMDRYARKKDPKMKEDKDEKDTEAVLIDEIHEDADHMNSEETREPTSEKSIDSDQKPQRKIDLAI